MELILLAAVIAFAMFDIEATFEGLIMAVVTIAFFVFITL